MVCLQCKVSEHQTSPPGYLSESDLISLMEKHGIGTVRWREMGILCMELGVSGMYFQSMNPHCSEA